MSNSTFLYEGKLEDLLYFGYHLFSSDRIVLICLILEAIPLVHKTVHSFSINEKTEFQGGSEMSW